MFQHSSRPAKMSKGPTSPTLEADLVQVHPFYMICTLGVANNVSQFLLTWP